MNRGHNELASSSYDSSQSKRKWSSLGESSSFDDESTRKARKVADHYSARSNQTLEEREASPIIHLKKLNNWIKSVLIQRYAHKGDAVLDLACGKGGDLIKWDKAQIGYYVGVDIAEGSIRDCRTRYNGDADQQQRRKKFSFPARLICADCYGTRLDEYLSDDAPFDICSCQFALHYSWSTEARARRALANISALLQPGGYFIGTMPDANVIIKKLRDAEGLTFGNSVYWISFDEEYAQKKFRRSSPFGIQYKFHLEDAVDCPEWVVPFNDFKSLAEEDIFLGGTDTTSTVIEWAMTELIRNPKIMKQVQDEVRSVVGGKGKVQKTDIQHLHYFKMILKETLRLHPPAPLLVEKEVISGFKLDEYDIHPKTRLIINAWAIGREETYWERPEEFFPDRFMNSPVDTNGRNFHLIPFGAGRRICPGMNMGMAMVEITLANLLYAFNWDPLHGMTKEDIDLDESLGIVMRKKNPLIVMASKHTMMQE